MADAETLRRRASSCPSRSPPHPPLRGTFSPSKAGEKGKGGRGEGKWGGRAHSFSLRPTKWGEGKMGDMYLTEQRALLGCGMVDANPYPFEVPCPHCKQTSLQF